MKDETRPPEPVSITPKDDGSSTGVRTRDTSAFLRLWKAAKAAKSRSLKMSPFKTTAGPSRNRAASPMAPPVPKGSFSIEYRNRMPHRRPSPKLRRKWAALWPRARTTSRTPAALSWAS